MTYRFAECELDLDRQELRLDGSPRPTEPQVFGLIVFLIENRDRVVSKDELIEAVWAGRIVSDAALNSRISAARQAMGDDGRTQAIIRTIARRGYRFVAEVDAGEATPPQAGRPRPGAGSETASAPGSGPAEANGPASVHKPTLAVLPFENLSGERDQFYLADGITEDIITALSKNRWLLVLARNATIAFRDRRPPASEIAAQLGADYLLSGSVRRSGERIRISVELVDGGLGSHIWGERYDRRMDDIFDLQDEITETIAARIEPELATAERRRVKRKPPKSLDAWDHYLLGLAQFYTFEKAGNEKAQALFRRAIELDPEFAEAQARLAYSIVMSMVYFDSEPRASVLDEALEIARRAVALDDQDAVGHFILGRVHIARREHQKAVQEMEASIRLNPCLAVTYCGLGDALTYTDRIDDALVQFEHAIRLSPHDPYRWGFYSYRALAHLFRGDHEAAAEWAEKAVDTPNSQYWSNAHLVAAHGYLDRPEATRAAVQELLRRKPNFTRGFARKHLFYLQSEQQIEAYIEGLRRAGISD